MKVFLPQKFPAIQYNCVFQGVEIDSTELHDIVQEAPTSSGVSGTSEPFSAGSNMYTRLLNVLDKVSSEKMVKVSEFEAAPNQRKVTTCNMAKCL